MTESEVYSHRKTKGDSFALVCELTNGNRFGVKQLSRKGNEIEVKLSDGTTAKADAVQFIERAHDAKEMQKFLLKQ